MEMGVLAVGRELCLPLCASNFPGTFRTLGGMGKVSRVVFVVALLRHAFEREAVAEVVRRQIVGD